MTEAQTKEKPFFFTPPWNILFELHKLANLRPWEISIAFLLTTFLEEMEKRGEVDFRASGVALDSSATILLMKSKLLLKLEEPPAPPRMPLDNIPPPLFLPVRYELTSTTVQELLKVLDEVLKGESLFALKPRTTPILPTPPDILPPVNIYLMEIEKQMEKLLQTLLKNAVKGKVALFSKIIEGLNKLEAIKTFIVLLFLAQKGDVSLWQDENLTDIYITLSTGATSEKPMVGVI
ncbi:MAG TPA: segregation/condensation protein A [Candidatus Bathyarchaeia archaeon]|nr:segregation/condensation protein A [Candidatus Bathyarchaeia archaeon]